MSSEPIPPRLTYEQVGAWLGRSATHVQRLVRERGLPAHREGRRVWFDRFEVQKWIEEHDDEGDNRITPVRPLKRHGGTQNVYPSQTIGDLEHCWCGDVLDHEWPGKDTGAPHPHDHEGMQQVVVVQQEQADDRHIDRKDLRGYHGTLKDFIVKCVNANGLRYRFSSRSEILLYPPDNSRPISIYARNTDSQMRSLRQWYAAHVEPFKVTAEGDVDQAIRNLAEAKNDPAEHPTPPDPEQEPDQSTGSDDPEWKPYLTEEGEEVPNFETDGKLVRCTLCLGTETEYVSDKRTGVGGHNRMLHRDTSNLRTPEAMAKGLDTRRYNRLRDQVEEANRILARALGQEVANPKQVQALTAEIATLRAEVAEQKKRADEAETKLALMREAFQGLE